MPDLANPQEGDVFPFRERATGGHFAIEQATVLYAHPDVVLLAIGTRFYTLKRDIFAETCGPVPPVDAMTVWAVVALSSDDGGGWEIIAHPKDLEDGLRFMIERGQAGMELVKLGVLAVGAPGTDE